MNKLCRIYIDDNAPTLNVVGAEAISIGDWSERAKAPTRRLLAWIDRAPKPREFCRVAPGMLGLADASLVDDHGHANSLYYALHWCVVRVELSVDSKDFSCFVPELILTDGKVKQLLNTAPFGLPASVFRIRGFGTDDLFSFNGLVENSDELPQVYARERCAGLRFEPVDI